MGSALDNFPGTIVCWYLPGNRIIPGFLRWCEIDFVHSRALPPQDLSCQIKQQSKPIDQLPSKLAVWIGDLEGIKGSGWNPVAKCVAASQGMRE